MTRTRASLAAVGLVAHAVAGPQEGPRRAARPLLSAASMSPSSRLAAIIIGALAVAAAPSRTQAGGLTLGAGKINLTLTAEVNVSKDAVAKPLSIAPDVSYGVNDKLTVSLVHSTFMTTGFRGKAGAGLCLTGDTKGCPNVYDNVGAEALYAVKDGPLSVGVGGGVHALSLDAGFYDLKVGAKLRYATGPLTFTSAPSLFVGLTERDLNKERIYLPIAAQFKVGTALAVGASTGINGPIDGFGDNWQVTLGASVTYAVQPALTLGSSFVFGKLLGGADATGVDFRALQIWASYTR